MREKTHIRPLLRILALDELGQDLDAGHGLEGDAGEQALVVDVADQVLGVGGGVGRALGALGGAREGGLVVEAVQVAAGLLELLDPFLGLWFVRCGLATVLLLELPTGSYVW